MTQPALTLVDEASPQPPDRNAAVQRCCAARDRSLQESRAKKRDLYDTRKLANEAFCAAMPDLTGYETSATLLPAQLTACSPAPSTHRRPQVPLRRPGRRRRSPPRAKGAQKGRRMTTPYPLPVVTI